MRDRQKTTQESLPLKGPLNGNLLGPLSGSLLAPSGVPDSAGVSGPVSGPGPVASGGPRNVSNGGGARAVALSRDEMNLAEFPLTVLSTRSDPKIKTLEFTDFHRAKNGEMIERKWIITGADKFGLPTSTDDDVILGLIRLTMDHGFKQRKVFFTRYELLKTLRWTTEGRSYQRLIKALDRLSGVRIRASNSFYDNSSKSYQTVNFGIIDSYEVNDHRGSKELELGEAPKSFFVWSEMLFDSFQAGFIKKIDLDMYFSLRSAVSRRLYRYLDKHFYFKNTVERPLLHLAFEKLGLSRNYKYISSVRQQIEPAAEELQRVGFISSFEVSGRGEGTMIRFCAAPQVVLAGTSSKRAGDAAASGSEESSRASTGFSSDGGIARNGSPHSAASQQGAREDEGSLNFGMRNQLIEALVSRGITVQQAKRLLLERNATECELIDEIIRYYDSLVDKNDPKISRNRLGFLYRAVENPHRFTIPAAFRSQQSQSRHARSRGVRTESARGQNGVHGGSALRPEHQPLRRGATAEQKPRYANAVSGRVTSGGAAAKGSGGRANLSKASAGHGSFARTGSVSEEELKDLISSVEKRLATSAREIPPDGFREAVEAAVREQLLKQ